MSAVSSSNSAYALQTQGLVKRFGGITATDHVNPVSYTHLTLPTTSRV